MKKYASKVVEQAIAWLGKNESDGSHKEIIDIYNSQKPLPRGYKVKYNDEWCATTVSAISVTLDYTDIIPTECSCGKMIELLKTLGSWVEDESVTPKAGWIAFYDWQDNGVGDNRGWSDHVGIVEKVQDGKITVIEGNHSNSVKRHIIDVNAIKLRGYGAPKYDTEEIVEPTPVTTPETTPVSESNSSSSKLVVDGKWGSDTTTRLQQIFGTTADGKISNQHLKYRDSNPGLRSGWDWQQNPNGKGSQLIKAMQRWAGMPASEQDGEIGPKTIKAFQIKLGTTIDGKVSNPSQMVKALQKWANEQ